MLYCKNPRTTTGEITGENVPENSSSSTSVVASNIDLLRQILLCLPVKSLLVFKSVSKQWLSLISDPYFVHNHCLQNRLAVPGLFLHKPWFGRINPEFEFIFLDGRNINGGVPFKTPTFVNDSSGIKIEQSCNGLLCCSSFRSNSIDRTYYIYNPSTKHYTVLPKSQLRKNGFVSVCSVSLAFDPLKSNHYEVVCIWRNDKDDYQIEIYYSKTATWRVSGYPFPASDGSLFSRPGVFWNGSLHWISLRESCDWTRLRESYVYFDTGRELLIKMPVPPIPNGEWDRRTIKYFGECNGHLHLIEIYGPVTSRFDILEMDIDYSLWTVKYRVDLEILSIAYREMVRDDDADEEELDHFDFSILHVFDHSLVMWLRKV